MVTQHTHPAAGSNNSNYSSYISLCYLGIGLVIGALAGAIGSAARNKDCKPTSNSRSTCTSQVDADNDDDVHDQYDDGNNNNHDNNIIVPYAQLYDFSCRCLVAAGCDAENAAMVVTVLLAADLRGITSHGIQRLHLYCFEIKIGAVNGTARPRLIHSQGGAACAVMVDGQNAQGAVVGCFAMNAAVDIAKQHGCAVVVCKNSNHYGIAGYYTDYVARNHGMLCMSMTNTSAIVVPTHSKEACLGTNPISLAAPCSSIGTGSSRNGNPVLIDMATTTVPIGRVEVYQQQGKTLPSTTWAVDANGKPCTDPSEIIDHGGAMLPLGGASELTGGHKGYCSALMVELLCGVLSGNKFGKNVDMTMNPRALNVKDTGAQISHFFLVIDPNAIQSDIVTSSSSSSSAALSPVYPERVAILAQQLRSLHRVDPQVAVRVPGDRSSNQAHERMQHGIPLYPAVVASLQRLSLEYNVELPFVSIS
jgi:L-2-hydroxycarboxylate dehydrogenase (NAD+)